MSLDMNRTLNFDCYRSKVSAMANFDKKPQKTQTNSLREFTFIELVCFSLEGFPFKLFVRLGGFDFLMLFVRLGGLEGFGDFVWVLFGRVGILDMFFNRGI